MKKIVLLVGVLFACSVVRAQVEVSELFIPSAPGFILADKAPASIEKPTTPKAFGVSLLNLWEGGAVEATPFWFTNKPLYTYEEWIKKKVTLVETFNISAATFRVDSASALSVGFRTQILRIYDKVQRQKILAQEEAIITALTTRTPGGGIDLTKVEEESSKLDKLEAKGFVALEIAGAIIGSSNTNNAMIGLGEAATGNKEPFTFGHEWNADSTNQRGHYYSYFSLAFKVELCA